MSNSRAIFAALFLAAFASAQTSVVAGQKGQAIVNATAGMASGVGHGIGNISGGGNPPVITPQGTEQGICASDGTAPCAVSTINNVGDVIFVTCFSEAASCTPQDTNGETWTVVKSGIAVAAGGVATQSYAKITVAGADQISGSGGTVAQNKLNGIIVNGFTSSSGWKALDPNSAAIQTLGSSCSVTFGGATAQANELIYAVCGSAANQITSASGFTLLQDNGGNSCDDIGNATQDCADFYKTLTSVGTPAFTTNDLGAAFNAAFITGFEPN